MRKKIKQKNNIIMTVPKKKSNKKKKRNFKIFILLCIIVLEILVLIKTVFKKDDNQIVDESSNQIIQSTQANDKDISKFTVFVDPGHGFSDDGTLSPQGIGNINESKTVLAVGLKLKDFLLEEGFNVVLSRESNYDERQEDEMFKLRNNERVEKAEEISADVFVSLHVDALDEKINGFDEVNGYTVYYCDNEVKKSENVELFAKCIMDSFLKATNVSKIQMKSMETDEAFYVVNHTTMPSILFELGYCTNREDAARLADENWQTKAAKGISNGVLDYFNKLKEIETTNTKQTSESKGSED